MKKSFFKVPRKIIAFSTCFRRQQYQAQERLEQQLTEAHNALEHQMQLK